MHLELACFNLESARIAEVVGVHRLELCEDYTSGGITPSLNFFTEARKLFHDKIFVMIRPRPGSFVYSEEEFNTMLRSLEKFKSLGADGFVCGFMNEDQTINESQLSKFIEMCQPFPFTFHRAFDQVHDWKTGLDQLIEAGCNRILSSGKGKNAIEGFTRLKEMNVYAGDKIIILPGGGIRSLNVKLLMDELHPVEIHTAAIVNFSEGKDVADEGELREMISCMVRP